MTYSTFWQKNWFHFFSSLSSYDFESTKVYAQNILSYLDDKISLLGYKHYEYIEQKEYLYQILKLIDIAQNKKNTNKFKFVSSSLFTSKIMSFH